MTSPHAAFPSPPPCLEVQYLLAGHKEGQKSGTAVKLRLKQMLRSHGVTSGRIKTKWGTTAFQAATVADLAATLKRLVVSQSGAPLVAAAMLEYITTQDITITMEARARGTDGPGVAVPARSIRP